MEGDIRKRADIHLAMRFDRLMRIDDGNIAFLHKTYGLLPVSFMVPLRESLKSRLRNLAHYNVHHRRWQPIPPFNLIHQVRSVKYI